MVRERIPVHTVLDVLRQREQEGVASIRKIVPCSGWGIMAVGYRKLVLRVVGDQPLCKLLQ